ncbi:MAG: hypothetical protein HPPSJP_2790 [Candidatus Hepatoplasma scabrum]|nr:MAG: hypothetical protein HPPSJP_2790 [Candidatus Hepatoplasma sp.]
MKRNKNLSFFGNQYLLELTFFYFKKLVTSYWFYLGIILIPLFFCLFLLTQLPAFLTVGSTIGFALIFNTIIFYGVLFFNFRKSHFYFSIEQKFDNHKFMIHLPIFFNLVIIAFITFSFSLFFIFLFDQLNWIAARDWTHTEGHYYQLSKISDYRWGLLIYYISIIFIVSISVAFLIQILSKNLNFYFLLMIFIFILIMLFSGTAFDFSTFVSPRSNNSEDLLYSYNPETQVLTFKPYLDPSNNPNLRFLNNFSFFTFMKMFNPFYYITEWGQYDIFTESYATKSLSLPGLPEIVIDQNDPSTWVLYDYVMFSFTNWLWASYIFAPYLFIIFYTFLAIFIAKKKKKR